MTPERQKWWGSLSQREKMLRKQIEAAKIGISYLKFALQSKAFTDEDKEWLTPRMKEQKVILIALKHELDRTTVAVYVGRLKEGVSIYRCKKCGGIFKDFEQTHCCWCGRKIAEKLRSRSND